MKASRGFITLAKARIADEIGFDDSDLASLYGVDVAEVDDHIAALEVEPLMMWQRILEDVDALRAGYRRRIVSDAQLIAMLTAVQSHTFGAAIETLGTTGRIGWQINPADAQWVTDQSAQVFDLNADEQAYFVRWLSRMIAWPNLTPPQNDAEWQRRVVDMATYLVELAGIV